MTKILNNKACPYCGRYNNRAVTIDAIILQDNKILLIKRGSEPDKDLWALPGGHVDWDETIEEAVKREVKEEIGVKVTAIKMLGIYSDPKRHPKQSINVPFSVEIEGELKIGDDAKDFRWFELDKLPKPLAFDHEKSINDYLKIK
jgi:8-oxo-dGTP diphosphatase